MNHPYLKFSVTKVTTNLPDYEIEHGFINLQSIYKFDHSAEPINESVTLTQTPFNEVVFDAQLMEFPEVARHLLYKAHVFNMIGSFSNYRDYQDLQKKFEKVYDKSKPFLKLPESESRTKKDLEIKTNGLLDFLKKKKKPQPTPIKLKVEILKSTLNKMEDDNDIIELGRRLKNYLLAMANKKPLDQIKEEESKLVNLLN